LALNNLLKNVPEHFSSCFGRYTLLFHFSVLLKRDQQTNKSRGFGFITYENPADAKEAVKELDKQVDNYG